MCAASLNTEEKLCEEEPTAAELVKEVHVEHTTAPGQDPVILDGMALYCYFTLVALLYSRRLFGEANAVWHESGPA